MEYLSDVLYIIFFLLMLGFVIFLAYYSTRWLGKKSFFAQSNSSRNMEILDRLHLTQDKSLLIVKVAQRRLLLSITQQNISKVLEFSEDEAIISIDQGNTTNFSNLLKDTMTKSTFFKKNTQEHKEENP